MVGSQVFHHYFGGMPALLHGFTARNSINIGVCCGRGMSGGTTTGTYLGDESEGEMAGKVTVVGGSDSKMVGGEYDWVSSSSRSVTREVGDWNFDIIRGDEQSSYGWSQMCFRVRKCHLSNSACSLITTDFIVGL